MENLEKRTAYRQFHCLQSAANPKSALCLSILSRTPANQQYFAPNIESALTLIKAQIGYTICYDVASLRDPQLCYIPVQDINETISFGIFFHRDNDHPILQSFLKYCFELFHTS